MKLKEIFDQLTYGELSQISIGGGEQGVISEANYPRILAHINLGLTELYKRFLIKQENLTIQLVQDVHTYPLNSKFSEANTRSQATPKFIKDIGKPFKDNINKIEAVYTDAGTELPLNDTSDETSVTTPSISVLFVPAHPETDFLKVSYRAAHIPITQPVGYFDPSVVEVDLPNSYLSPLLLFVASRVHTPTGMTGEFNAGNNYAAKYEQACALLETTNIRVDSFAQTSKLRAKGWP